MTEREERLQLTEPELKEAEERSSATARVVHEAVRREGEDELKRSPMALLWSGLAAGLSMGFSLMLEGAMRARLPHTAWAELISRIGYSAGFVIVILGRQQLFTENTLTVVLPLFENPGRATTCRVARLWTVVFLANLAGALAIGWVLGHTDVFTAETRENFTAIARQSLQPGFGIAFLRAIFAGWLLALLVWLLPFAEHARFFVIIGVTWTISVCGFPHVVAGAVDVFYLATGGLAPWRQAIGDYLLPALVGNIAGGVSLVSALNHAQVSS